jgi:molecular chaperone DnaK
MAKIIGIDLGTSNSAASYVEAGKPKMIPSAEGTTLVGGKAFPSYVAVNKDGELLVGEPARRQAVANPEGTAQAFKRKMGEDVKIKLNNKEFTPQQLSAFILQKIKKDSEMYLGTKIDKAVVTVPAYFNDAQRQATKDAGAIAGLEVVRIINEPTAAALAYGLDKTSAKDQQVLVFDFGGGTLDVTIMNFGGGVFEVISTSGDTQLGGHDMDNTLLDYVVEEFKKQENIDLHKDKMAMQRIREAAEKAKIELSSVFETEINLPFITATNEGPKHFLLKITRTKLEQLVKPIVDKCKHPVEQALADAKLKPQDIEKIILVGGPTRMPMIQKFLEDYFGPKIERGIDPMECVAMGAAVQGAVLAGDTEVKEVQLLDVIPLTLGIETLGGVMTPLIDRNTTIPTSKSQTFSTAADSQTSVEIHVLQGERSMANDNRTLGRFILDGIPPAPRGMPQIEVSFDINADGILKVTAKDKATSKTQNIEIRDSKALSKEEIEKMKKESEMYAAEDRKKKETIDIKNQADALIYSSEKTLKEFGDKIKEEDKKKIEERITELKKATSGADMELMKKEMDALSQEVQKIGAEMYKQAGPQTGSQAGGPTGPQQPGNEQPPKDEGPIEGEVEEKPKS